MTVPPKFPVNPVTVMSAWSRTWTAALAPIERSDVMLVPLPSWGCVTVVEPHPPIVLTV